VASSIFDFIRFSFNLFRWLDEADEVRDIRRLPVSTGRIRKHPDFFRKRPEFFMHPFAFAQNTEPRSLRVLASRSETELLSGWGLPYIHFTSCVRG
jgi:hypothetical protein